MKRLAFRTSLAVAIMVALLSVFGASAAHASPRRSIQPALYIQCSSTYQHQERDYVWTDTGNFSSYNQRVDTKLFSLRDSYSNVYCDEMHAETVLRYKLVGQSSTIDVHMCNKNQYCYYGSASVPPNTSTSYWTYVADTGWQTPGSCAEATGSWNVPGALDVNLPGTNIVTGQYQADWVCP